MYSGSSEMKPDQRKRFIDIIEKYSCITGPVNIMEVCGTHTMSISRSGLRTVLPGNISLLSGPGCPVCVTSQADIDMVLELSDEGICLGQIAVGAAAREALKSREI